MTVKEDYIERVIRIVEKITRRKLENFNLKGSLRDQLSIDSIQVVELFAAQQRVLLEQGYL